jgi:hypothetical protein
MRRSDEAGALHTGAPPLAYHSGLTIGSVSDRFHGVNPLDIMHLHELNPLIGLGTYLPKELPHTGSTESTVNINAVDPV